MNAQDSRGSRDAWNAIATGYDEFVTPTHTRLANEGLARIGIQPGMKLLDVACGTGALSICAARLGAQVTATDISPAMVELLDTRARIEGLSLETCVMDGQALELGDDVFDIAGSQFGVMLFPDLPRGLSELVRVTKPGGKVLLSCFGQPPQIEFLRFFVRGVQAVVPDYHGLPKDPVPLPFQVADPGMLRQVCVDAGLNDVMVEAVTETLELSTGQQLWDWVLNSNPIPRMILGTLNVSEDQEAVIIDELEKLIRERAGGNGHAKLTSPVNIAIGTAASG